MSNTAYEFEGKVLGANHIAELVGFAPKRISRTIHKRLYIERNKFVGSRKGKTKGSFTSSVLRRRRRNRPGTMPMSIAGIFRGHLKVHAEDDVDGTVLRMGVLKQNPKGIVKGIMDLQEGYTRTSSKYMPIPIYGNLEKLGISKWFSRAFHQMIAAGDIVTIMDGGNVLFVSQELIDQGNDVYNSMVFYGTRRVTAKAMDFGFIKQWNTRWPKVQKRMQNAINRELRGIERGFVKPK